MSKKSANAYIITRIPLYIVLVGVPMGGVIGRKHDPETGTGFWCFD